MKNRVIEISPVKGSKLRGSVKVPDKLVILGSKEQPCKGWWCCRIPTSKHGDKRVVWDASDSDHVVEARKFFDLLIEQGMVPYAVAPDGKLPATIMDDFDPKAEEVMFLAVAAVVGLGE